MSHWKLFVWLAAFFALIVAATVQFAIANYKGGEVAVIPPEPGITVSAPMTKPTKNDCWIADNKRNLPTHIDPC